MDYKFYMTIGDWSDDGHGKHEDYLIESNAPVEQVREVHFQIKGVTGIDIEEICSEYGEDEIDPEQIAKLERLGFRFEDSTGMGRGVIVPQEMVRLWLFLLAKTDCELKMKLVDEVIPSFHFCGFDQKGRHIGDVGYGLFKI